MKGNTWLYTGLIVVVVALMIVGIVVVSNSNKEKTKELDIPTTDPVLTMAVSNTEGNEQSQLSIYEDGTVIEWNDSGFTGSSSQLTRIWRFGTAETADLNALYSGINDLGFNDLNEFYYPEGQAENIPTSLTDDYLTITIDTGDLDNTVTAWGYFTTGADPYGDLPSPLDEIYSDLQALLTSTTEEVKTESVSK